MRVVTSRYTGEHSHTSYNIVEYRTCTLHIGEGFDNLGVTASVGLANCALGILHLVADYVLLHQVLDLRNMSNNLNCLMR